MSSGLKLLLLILTIHNFLEFLISSLYPMWACVPHQIHRPRYEDVCENSLETLKDLNLRKNYEGNDPFQVIWNLTFN